MKNTQIKTQDKGCVLLAAGGTGGHLFPAESLAHALIERGYSVELATDARARKFADDFPAKNIHVIQSATVSGKNPIALFTTGLALAKGYLQSRRIIKAANPKAVIGFGGYPTLPPLICANRMGIPTLLHEQNAVLGRANKMLAKKAGGVAVGFNQVAKVPNASVVETGNPIRPMVEAVLDAKYKTRKKTDTLRLVVFGGSQGARIFSEILPAALELLSKNERATLSILQQARPEDEAALKAEYKALGVKAEIASFFKNMPQEISDAHFVIARAGASSITELAVLGRPSLLVPLPGSLDGDQENNAIAMKEAGGAFVVRQSDLSAQRLADILSNAIEKPKELEAMGKAAKKTGIVNAADKLADCVECVIGGGDIAKL
ncbi:MAG: undecaprenyldiphospho-muramoylpentapeptide beta-N-acetylglucosaminyltransferase [Nitratireductor sp.]